MRFTRGTVVDLVRLVLNVALGALTVLTPASGRPHLLAALTAIWVRARPALVTELVALIGEQLPTTTPANRRDIARKTVEIQIEKIMCRGYTMFRHGWPARIDTIGVEHLRSAHDANHGVVVWVMTFLEATPFNLVAEANGFPVTHLSSPEHGIRDKGPISRRVVAPVLLRGEFRSQRRRILIDRSGGLGYLRELRKVLTDEQGTVTIRGDEGSGRQVIAAPLLGATARFPTGAASLAHQTGAPLLTTATIRLGPFHHQVLIDEPIGIDRGLDRRAFQHGAVQEYADRLERRARAHPASRHLRRAG